MSPFSTTGSVISTDLDNMLRGLYSDSVLANSTTEATLKSVSIAGSTLAPTGGFHVIACGSITGTNGSKTLRLKLGATIVMTITQAAGTTSDWFFDAWCFNTSTGSQRWFIQRSGNDVLTSSFDYANSVEDTTANKTLAVTGQLGNAADSITATMIDVFIVQIT